MSAVGIFPAPPGSEGYVELGATRQGTLWKKQILTLGKPFVHPKTGQPLTLGEEFWQQLDANFRSKRATDIVQVPVVGADNKHTEDPMRNIGVVTRLEREGDKVFAFIDARDAEASGKLGKTLLGASAMLNLNARDNATGERVGAALYHVAVTNHPHLTDLAPFEQVVAATGEAFDTLPDGSVLAPQVLLLCASEVEADQPVMLSPASRVEHARRLQSDNNSRPDIGRHHMQYDEQRDETDRLGPEAQRLSQYNGGQGSVTAMAARLSNAYAGAGRGSRREYDHARIEAERPPARLSAVDSLRAVLPDERAAENLTPLEVCTAFALQLSARPELVALTGGQASQASVMTSARREAFECSDEVSTDTGGLHEDYVRPGESKDPEAIAEALIGMSNELGGVDDPDALALTAVSESDRIAAQSADELGLAWQPASGAGVGHDSAEAAIARHPELAFMFKGGRTSSRKHPARSGRNIGTKSRAHSSDLDEDHRDEDQPARGGAVHAGVRAIIEASPHLFTDGKGREGEGTGNRVTRPKSAAQRHLEETYALDGGRPQNRITR